MTTLGEIVGCDPSCCIDYTRLTQSGSSPLRTRYNSLQSTLIVFRLGLPTTTTRSYRSACLFSWSSVLVSVHESTLSEHGRPRSASRVNSLQIETLQVYLCRLNVPARPDLMPSKYHPSLSLRRSSFEFAQSRYKHNTPDVRCIIPFPHRQAEIPPCNLSLAILPFGASPANKN